MRYWERRLRYNKQLWVITKVVVGTFLIINGVYVLTNNISEDFNEKMDEKYKIEQRKEIQQENLEWERESKEEFLKEYYGEDWMEKSGYKVYEKEDESNEWYLKENKEQKEKETREWDSKSSSF